MYNSGIIYVDATGLDIHESEVQTVNGLYRKLEAAIETGKLVILTGVVNGETPVTPIPVMCTMGAGATITMNGFAAVVGDDDEVTPVSV